MLLKTRKIDPAELDYEELLDLRLELLEENTAIKLALSKARRNYEVYGELSDRDWFDQNKERHKALVLDIDNVNTQMNKLRHRRAEANRVSSNSNFHSYKKFYELTAEIVPPDLFSKIVEEVNT